MVPAMIRNLLAAVGLAAAIIVIGWLIRFALHFIDHDDGAQAENYGGRHG